MSLNEIVARQHSIGRYLQEYSHLARGSIWRQAHEDRGALLELLKRAEAVTECAWQEEERQASRAMAAERDALVLRECIETALSQLAQFVPCAGTEKRMGDIACTLLGGLAGRVP